ncbi:MAG: type IV toxin-antitoxin system AbiEi family antitoxin [Candidatus Paceibacterota bacterium]
MKKINHILQEWPPRTVITSDWLKEHGVYKQLADSYEKSGWLERISRGAYKRKGDKISWPGGLYALQELQHLSVHVGGKTALELQGYSHYIRMDDAQSVVLWKTPDVRLPNWFLSYDWNTPIEVRSVTLFDRNVNALSETKVDNIIIEISATEQAVLEYLHNVPKHEGIDEANYIMEGLTSMRPSVLQKLLECCKSIKTKRLFLYMAEHHNHPWFKKIDLSSIPLGKGKREIIKGGKLDKTYNIVVSELSREDQ